MCEKDDCPIKYPIPDQECCCGGIIENVAAINYEQLYVCNECGAEWRYD